SCDFAQVEAVSDCMIRSVNSRRLPILRVEVYTSLGGLRIGGLIPCTKGSCPCLERTCSDLRRRLSGVSVHRANASVRRNGMLPTGSRRVDGQSQAPPWPIYRKQTRGVVSACARSEAANLAESVPPPAEKRLQAAA